MERAKIAIVGGGMMGGAIASGLADSQCGVASEISPKDVLVIDPSADKRAYFESELGMRVSDDVSLSLDSDVLVLAVKPQILRSVLDELRDALASKTTSPLFVSIAAGVPTQTIEDALFEEDGVADDGGAVAPRVVRVMPNMPLSVGCGASVVAGGRFASSEDVDYVCDLFSCLGYAAHVDEDDIDAVCAISGGGPAYVAYMISLLRDAGIAHGLDASLAENLAIKTIAGTCELISSKGVTPEDAKQSVCSPGGTTLAALAAMDKAGFADSIPAGIDAAIARSKELAKC